MRKNGQSQRGDLRWPGSGKAIVETKQTKRNESTIIQTKSTLKTTNI